MGIRQGFCDSVILQDVEIRGHAGCKPTMQLKKARVRCIASMRRLTKWPDGELNGTVNGRRSCAGVCEKWGSNNSVCLFCLVEKERVPIL